MDSTGGRRRVEYRSQSARRRSRVMFAAARSRHQSSQSRGQSFDNAKLLKLGRDHTGDQLARAVDTASQWFEKVSVDLIFGVPGEDMTVWKSDLRNVTSRGLSHVSSYGLTYEKGARYCRNFRKARSRLWLKRRNWRCIFTPSRR